MSHKVKFRGHELTVQKAKYSNDRIALQLYTEDGELYLTATVNVPDYPVLLDGHTFIKNYSENEGILQALIDAQIIEDWGIEIHLGSFGATAHLVNVII